jgi:hypothetical protein
VARGIAAVYLQLPIRHDDACSGLDMVSAEWFIIARICDDCDITVPIRLEHIGVISVSIPAT